MKHQKHLNFFIVLSFLTFLSKDLHAGGYTDDHNDGTLTGWTAAGSRTWSESGGYTLPADMNNNQGFLINDYNCANDGTLTATIQSLAQYNNRYGGIVFRYTSTSAYYFLAIYEQDPYAQNTSNVISIFKNSTDWNTTPIKSFTNLNFSGLNRHYPIKIVLSGSTFTFYLNNTLLGTHTDATHSSGKVGYAYHSQYSRYASYDASSWSDAIIGYTWDISTSSGIQAGNGTWGTNNYWTLNGTTLSAWPGSTWGASFAGSDGTYTITVNGTQSATSLTFANSGYNLSSGTLNILNDTISVASGKVDTISSVIAGNTGIKKTGSGELYIYGNNTFTGATIVYSGKLNVAHDNALGSTIGGTFVSSGSSLTLTGYPRTFAAEPLIINGTGTEFPGALRTGGSNAKYVTWQGNITLGSNSTIGATLSIDTLLISGVISGGYMLTKDGSGPLILTANNSYSGGTIINAGSLHIGNSGTTGSISGNITNNAAFIINRSDDITINSVISGSGYVTQWGAGSLTLSGNNAYTGPTIILSGALCFSSSSNLGSSASTASNLVLAGGTLKYIGAAVTSDRLFTLGPYGVLDASGTGALSLNNTGTMGFYGSGARVLTLTGSNSDNNELYAIIGDNGGATYIVKNGTGKWRIWGSNTYTGGTTLNSGTLEIRNNNALGNNTATTTLAGGTLILEPDLVSLQSKINLTGTVTISSATNTTLASQVYGNGTINTSIPSDKVLTLQGDLTNLKGTINHSQGYLRLGNAAAVRNADSLIINLSGTGYLTTRWDSLADIGALSGTSGTVVRSNNADGAGTTVFNIGYLNTNTTFAGTIVDNTRLTAIKKVGNGTLILTGASTHTGPTSVSGGMLIINGSTATGSSVTVGSGATLAGTGTIGGTVTVANGGRIVPGNNGAGTLRTGSLTLNTSSVLDFELGTLKDSIKVNGNLTLNGTLNISSLSGFNSGTYTLITYTGTLSGNGLVIGSLPNGFIGSVKASAGSVRLTITSARLKAVTVVQAAPRCSVYTNSWTLVFDNNAGGGITTLTDSFHGLSSGQGNQIGASQNLYYLNFDGVDSKSNGNGNWAVLKDGHFFANIRQGGQLSGINYTTDYTIHGSGKMFVKTTVHNRSGSSISGKTLRNMIQRRVAANMSVVTSHANANQSAFVLLSSDSSNQNDILLSVKDLWNTSDGAPNSATGFYSNEGSGYAGYENNNFSINAGQKQTWEFMVDFTHSLWDDSLGVGEVVDDFRKPDSLEIISGTLCMERTWENHLIGHWKFDNDKNDTARDFSGNNYHSYSTGSWTTGKWGGGVQFNGSQSITYPNNSNFNVSDHFTIMAWAKTSTLNGTSVIAGKHDGSKGWKLTGNSSGQITLTINNTQFSGTKNIADNTWRHVAACFVNYRDSVFLFVDGKLDGVYGGSYPFDLNTSSFLMGSGFTGALDDVRFYNDPVSDNTVKSIYQQGFRSAEGMYELRANNDNMVHIQIDGGTIKRYYPVFQIHNYWATSTPAVGCVKLNGTTLTENNQYFADLNDDKNILTIGLNSILTSDANRVYIDDNYTTGYQMTGETRKISCGIDKVGSTDYVWVKNFSGNTFADATSNQWYINWKMINDVPGVSMDGEMWKLFSSVTDPNLAIDTSARTNLIPGTDSHDVTVGYVVYNINGRYPRSSEHVTNAITYAIEESSAVRIVLRVNDRTVDDGGSSFKIKTKWTIYPTGQIFRWDSLHTIGTPRSAIYVGAYLNDGGINPVIKTRKSRFRGVLHYTSIYPDLIYAFLALKNTNGFQNQPFNSDTISTTIESSRSGFDFVDLSVSGSPWDSPPIELATYLDLQHSQMDSLYMDSVCNGIQYPSILMQEGSIITSSSGDLNGDGFNEREGAYILKANNNSVSFKIPARRDTVRYYPAFRITNYFAASKPEYVFAYRGLTAGDTVKLLEGYQYNIYHNKAMRELIIQIDSIFRDTIGIYISSDKTLAVKLSYFTAIGGIESDTIRWQTESEQDNLGFLIFRRIKPSFFDSLSMDIAGQENSLKNNGAGKLLRNNIICNNDTNWIKIHDKIIPGAESGVSYGAKKYERVDHDVHSGIVYEYKLESVDYQNVSEVFGPVEAMPLARLPKFELWRNFPNPFRSYTTIQFSLPEKSNINLNIYDLQGRLIKKLICTDKAFSAGTYRVVWNSTNQFGRRVAGGAYIYRLCAGNLIKSQKMLLSR